MPKELASVPFLLRWSEHVPASDVQDPLGLALRGSARLAGRLLYCITSITPRARYFSFLPWCVFDHQRREKGRPNALGLRNAITLREQALTLGCIAHHDGKPCSGGALVGTRGAQKWYRKGRDNANLRRMRFAQNPALSAYFNSLVNLGFFVTHEDSPTTDEEAEAEQLTFDDIELSELGLQLCKLYHSAIGRLAATRAIASPSRTFSVANLAELGKRGGLCELAGDYGAERDLLRQIFFDQVGTKGESHRVRRSSLLLMLELCRQLSTIQCPLDAPAFARAVYYGIAQGDESYRDISLPASLRDIATRWRMFYFHNYMGIALEGLFAWLVSKLGGLGLTGGSIDAIVLQLDERSVQRDVSELLGRTLRQRFGGTTPAMLFGLAEVPVAELDGKSSKALDTLVQSMTPLAEDRLEELIRSTAYLHSSTGLALALILLATTLGRYRRWVGTNYDQWLATCASDPYLDLIPPLVTAGLEQRLGNWWTSSWRDLAKHVLARYVVRQHLTMSYEKSWAGDRCLLQDDGQKVFTTGIFEGVGMGNVRFYSARQVLEDLALIAPDDDGVHRLTTEGAYFLKQEIGKEDAVEIS